MSAALFAQEAASHAPDFPVLSALVIVPAVGALVLALLPRTRSELTKPVAVLFTVATGALSLYVLAAFETSESGYQFEVDRISLFLVVLTGIIFPIAILATDPHHDAKPYYAWLLMLEAGRLGVFVSLDLFLFFVMFEIVLVPMYFLIGGGGDANPGCGAVGVFPFSMFGAALMLVGIVALAYLHRDAVQDENRAEAQEIQADTDGDPSPAQQEEIDQLQE